jgi:GR25 family glycosyltransferase involved in LPS biosynthesis
MFIDKIIVINLQRATERKNRILESFKRVGVHSNDVLFLPAFDADILDDYFDRKFFGKSMGRTFAKGELCCTLSHISAIKMSKALKYENVLILEDDVELCDDFLERVNNLGNQLPENWGQIYIGGIINGLGDKVNENIYKIRTDTMMGTHSYLLNHSVYDLISDKLLEFNSATDGEFNIIHKSGIMDTYIYNPLMTYQYDGYSYITYRNKDMKKMTNKYFKQ